MSNTGARYEITIDGPTRSCRPCTATVIGHSRNSKGVLVPTNGVNIFWPVDRPTYRSEEQKRATGGTQERLANRRKQVRFRKDQI